LEAFKNVDADGAHTLTANFIARETVLLDERHAPATACEENGRGASTRTGADDRCFTHGGDDRLKPEVRIPEIRIKLQSKTE
jgi:hypothetical protein